MELPIYFFIKISGIEHQTWTSEMSDVHVGKFKIGQVGTVVITSQFLHAMCHSDESINIALIREVFFY